MQDLRRRAWIAAAVVVVASLALIPFAGAASPAYSAKSKVMGKKLAEWSADWWQWAYTMPIGVNPLFDETGANAGVGQRGKVWFLCGVVNQDGVASRTNVNVPAGKPLLVPVIATEWDNAGLLQSDWLTLEELKAKAKQFADGVDPASFVFTVDGVALTDVAKRRVASITFDYPVVTGAIPVGFGADPGEIIYPAVGDGFWVMLKPLSPGITHTIHWEAVKGNTSYDITYSLNVLALNLP